MAQGAKDAKIRKRITQSYGAESLAMRPYEVNPGGFTARAEMISSIDHDSSIERQGSYTY